MNKSSSRKHITRIALVLLVALMLLPGAAQAAPAAQAGCTYRATFLADVTIPDNTVVTAGASFIKVWRLRNDGTCAWGPGTTVDSIALVGGSALGNSTVVPLVNAIQPGHSGDISVAFIAPTTAGTYRSEWKLRRTNGQMFGVGASGATPFYLQIIVKGGGSTPAAKRIQFAPGGTTASVSGRVTFPDRPAYLIKANAGQHMVMTIVSPNETANFSVQGVSDGQPYKRVENESRYFTLTLPSTQDYLINIATPGPAVDYILSVAIAP